MSQSPEARFQKQFMLWCGKNDYLCFHANVGMFFTKRKVISGATPSIDIWTNEATGEQTCFTRCSTGLPVGFSDLIVIGRNGEIAFVETKAKGNYPTQEQRQFIRVLRERGHRAGVAYDMEQAISIVKGTGLGYTFR